MKTILVLACILLVQNSIINKFKTAAHRKDCYSQGIFFLNQTHLFESCGLYQKSYYHVLQYQQGDNGGFELTETFTSIIPLRSQYFFEGATLFPGNNLIYILTWRENKVLQISPSNMSVVKELSWSRNGWGLTNNKTHMFVTDGSDTIFCVNAKMQIQSSRIIRDRNGKNVWKLNQLEFVWLSCGTKGYIYANIYLSDKIVKINYQKGQVVKQYDGSQLIANEKDLKMDEVLNGIAYQQELGVYIMTGKNWANYYKIVL